MTYILFQYLITNEFRYRYPSRKFMFIQLISIALGILVYGLTSEAIGPALKGIEGWQNYTYFQFVMIGEIFITLPAACAQIFVRTISHLHNLNNLEDIILNHKKPMTSLYQAAGSLLLSEVVHLSIWLLAALWAFDIRDFSIERFGLLFLLVLWASFIFLQIGFACGLLYLTFGRGQGIVGQLSYFFTVLAGVYFPTQAITNRLGDVSVYFSPYFIYMESVRSIWAGQGFHYWGFMVASSILGLLSFVILRRYFKVSAQIYLRQTRFFMSHS